jgi:hypothetical protein
MKHTYKSLVWPFVALIALGISSCSKKIDEAYKNPASGNHRKPSR